MQPSDLKPVMYEIQFASFCADERHWVVALQDHEGRIFIELDGILYTEERPNPDHILPMDTMQAMREEFETKVRIASDAFGARLEKFTKNLSFADAMRERILAAVREPAILCE